MGTRQAGHDALCAFLHLRLDHLRVCSTTLEGKLRRDIRQLLDRVDRGDLRKNDPLVGKTFHINYIVANTARYTMLVGMCSFLEEAMREIARQLIPCYEERIEKCKGRNWLRKHVRLLGEERSLDTSAVEDRLSLFHHIIALRNCIVHQWGNVAKARNPKTVEAAARRVETADISRDGYLLLGDQVVPEAIIAARRIMRHFLGART